MSMTAYEQVQEKLAAEPKTWLITGVAGFIGSNLLEALLRLNQLYEQLRINFLPSHPHLQGVKLVICDFRAGDIHHGLADTEKAATLLGHQPTHRIDEKLKVAMVWYVKHLMQQGKA